MRIVIASSGSVSVDEPDVFTGFSVAAADPELPAVLAALGPDSAPCEAPGHVMVSAGAVRRWVGRVDDTEWNRSFDGMLAYARTKGWTDASGSLVQAHIEPLG